MELRVRNLVKEPLSEAELRALAAKAGGIRELVAPKQRKAAEEVPDAKLASWLAEDWRRVRKPIVIAGKTVTLGFTAKEREALEAALP